MVIRMNIINFKVDEEKKKNFRKLPDLIEYIQGIGSAPVTYVERR